MKRLFTALTATALCLAASAQETYENTKLIESDLNGTARYVGMGGAMEALGADISTMSTNPAGIGLFRRSQVTGSFGMVMQEDAADYSQGNKTNMSFDQMGFVYVHRTGQKSFLNVGFTYRKSRNFDYILSAAGNLGGSASQNCLSYIKAINNNSGVTEMNISRDNQGLYNPDYYTSQLDNLYYNTFLFDQDLNHGYNTATSYLMNRANTGYIGEYDFNISGNVNDRFYWGLTVGLHDVHYKGIADYTEQLVNLDGQSVGQVTVSDNRRITGTGVDVKAGVIFRPIEDSPLRFGISVATPTWYDLTTENLTTLSNGTSIKAYDPSYVATGAYDFRVYTPWKFGLSAGTTVANMVALGLSYEFADYAHIDTRVIDGGYYDYYDDYNETTSSDEEMNRHTRETLKGVSTLKVGAEIMIDRNASVRFGYNYVSPMFKQDGFKDGSLDSYGTNYASQTDYTNWKSTNRLTCGFGYRLGDLNIDLAYQYSSQNGTFHPFMDSYSDYIYTETDAAGNTQTITEPIDNYADEVKVSNKRHQLILTLGYRF